MGNSIFIFVLYFVSFKYRQHKININHIDINAVIFEVLVIMHYRKVHIFEAQLKCFALKAAALATYLRLVVTFICEFVKFLKLSL